MLQFAEVHQSFGDSDASLAYAIAGSEDDPQQLNALADDLLAMGRPNAARELWQQILLITPDDSTAHFQLGLSLLPADPRGAYQHFEAVARDDVNASIADTLRVYIADDAEPAQHAAQIGAALVSLGYWDAAERSFTTALTLDPDYPEVWAYMALTRAHTNRSPEPYLSWVADYETNDSLIFLLAGLTYRTIGDNSLALVALHHAQGLDPLNASIAAELGATYRAEAELAEAEYWLVSAVELAPDAPFYWRLLAMFYAEEQVNLADIGLPVMQRAIDLNPDDAGLHAVYAWTLFQMQDVDTAQQMIDFARALAPDDPQVLYYQGLLYQYQDLPDLAQDTLRQLLNHADPLGYDVLAIRALEDIGQ